MYSGSSIFLFFFIQYFLIKNEHVQSAIDNRTYQPVCIVLLE